ncbi:MAG: substrate-binding domain-containing protein, partial [Bacillota bacterium]
PNQSITELHQLSVPVVLVDTYIKDPLFHTIGIDDRQGGLLATRYLIECGHREISFVSGSVSEQGVTQKRFLGYMDALNEKGLALNEKRLYLGTVSFDFAQSVADEMQRRGNQETAAFVTADILCMGLIKGMRRLGKHVPKDLSVVGFDDLDLACMADPSLTTIHQDIAEKGRNAVQIILDAAEGRTQKQERILPIRLVVRESVRQM